jgi:hypothetical protein
LRSATERVASLRSGEVMPTSFASSVFDSRFSLQGVPPT